MLERLYLFIGWLFGIPQEGTLPLYYSPEPSAATVRSRSNTENYNEGRIRVGGTGITASEFNLEKSWKPFFLVALIATFTFIVVMTSILTPPKTCPACPCSDSNHSPAIQGILEQIQGVNKQKLSKAHRGSRTESGIQKRTFLTQASSNYCQNYYFGCKFDLPSLMHLLLQADQK
ncbi:hypothetical protein OUZ56_018262 [Daphnia magna]|uniref:Uncharacterized protein n=1 Tax=Daphnia magna TaxID=35525 RepID=A0ABQ9Z8F2_9CRUS|nr:hypothetical protein OUZ56_018262 [Daphnia magna]